MDQECVEGAAVDSFVDGIRNWEVQLLVRMHCSKTITAALAYALEVETARRASYGPVMVNQLREENSKKSRSSSKGERLEYQPTVPPGGKEHPQRNMRK